MSKAVKTSLVALLLSVCVLPTGASAIIFFCGDICTPSTSCNRNCTDDNTGNPSNCGAWGCCVFNQSCGDGLFTTAPKPNATSAVCPAADPETTSAPLFFAAP
ncbi:MAG: hypothetical protein WAM82_10115 [Thermoanaerobaculia bacterium]